MRHLSFTLFFFLIALGTVITAQDPKTAFLEITVENAEGNLIVGLKPDNFRLFIDGKPQKMDSMQVDRRPATLAWVVDVSKSMLADSRDNRKENSRVTWAREAIVDFVGAGQKDNKYFLITFAEEVQFLGSMNEAEILTVAKKESNFLPKENNRTRLFDALQSAIEKAVVPENDRQILFLMTDGGRDYVSSTTHEDIKRLVKNKNLTVCILLMDEPDLGTSSPITDGMRLEELAEISGGLFWHTVERIVIRQAVAKTAAMIQNRYRIGFSPAPVGKPDKKQKIEVKLELSPEEKKKIGRTVLRYRKQYSPALEKVADNK